jgi:hypothetical protein
LAVTLDVAEPVVSGLSVPATIRVVNRGSAPAMVSSRLNLMEGDLRLSIEDPDGATRVLKGWQADTQLRRVALPPGEQIESGTNLLWTVEGAVFPKPGAYTVQAEYDPSPRAETVVSAPLAVTVRLPRTEAERKLEALLKDGAVREAIVLGKSETAPDKLEVLAQQFPETFDGKLAELLLSANAVAGSDVASDKAFQIADPITLARWITMISTPYSDAARGLTEKFTAFVEARSRASDGKLEDLAALNKALRIIRGQAIEST